MPGPMPKRTDQVRRRNAKPETDKVAADELEWPEAPSFWHPLVVEWYESLQKPAISCFFQQTDVAQARIVGQMLSDQFERKDGVSAAAMPALFSAMADLLTTEGARRRLRIEIERREAEEKAPVLDIVDRRRRLAEG